MNNLIDISSTINDAIKTLNLSDVKTLIILNNKKFIGTITDGDIRRGLIKKISLNSNILKIANKRPYTTNYKTLSDKMKLSIKSKKIYCVPIVKKNLEYIGYHKISDNTVNTLQDNSLVVVMAGGRGKRLDPITKKIPKPLVKIKNKPLIEHIVNKTFKDNFKKILITIHYKGNMIKNFFKKNKYSKKILFFKENKPLGTVGSLSLINVKGYENCILTNSDIISNFSFLDILRYHELNKSDLTIATYFKKTQSKYGNLILNGKNIRNIMEKPLREENVSVGIYVIKSEMLKFLKKGKFCDMPSFINKLINLKKKVVSFPLHENWIDIGNHESLNLARKKFNSKF
jgi:dTDP-glucose pyrophosphorylase/CBS domain-containing protein